MTNQLDITITVDDPDFFQALQDPEGFLPLLGEGMGDLLDVYKEVAWTYAPESEANRPGRLDQDGHPLGYYERGRGWWYPVLTHNMMPMNTEIPVLGKHPRSPKTMGVKALMAKGLGPAGYKLIPSSEQMHDRWVTEVVVNQHDVTGFLSNTASYSDYVQGTEQVSLHAERGWQTVEKSFQDPAVQQAIQYTTLTAIDRYFHLKGE